MVFNVAESCTLFNEANYLDQSIDVYNGDPELTNFANYQFSGEMVSYSCYPQCPPNKLKRGPRGAAC
jgi:hypothetical protein